jgi:HK97 family phage portal protein
MKRFWPWRPFRPESPGAPESTGASPVPNRKSGIGMIALHGLAQAEWGAQDYGTLARDGFMRNPVAYRAARMLAETAAAIPWLLYEGAREAAGHPLLTLLERPNEFEAGATFFEALYGHLLLSGNAYLNFTPLAGRGGVLHALRPDRVTLRTDHEGWPETYVHAVAGRGQRFAPMSGKDGGVIHLKLFHPLDDHRGFAPLAAAMMALQTHNATGAWNKALLDNSARPSGALVYAPGDGGNLTEEQFDRLKGELEDGYTGAARAGRPLLLEGGLDWKPMSMTPKDMDFIEAKHAAAREIALAFGVPPMLLGIPGDNTYANYAEANRAFYRLTVLPLVGRVARELTARLAPAFGDGLRLWFDADRVEGLSAERDALWARVAAAPFLSDDEKREAVGYSPRGAKENTNG